MTYIKTIPVDAAEGRLKTLYDRVKGPDGRIDNIMAAHSLRPHSMEGHMALYKNVLHHNANTTPKWFLETVGVYVSMLNKCDYCIDHHYAGLRRLLQNGERADEIHAALQTGLETGTVETSSLSNKECAALDYVFLLTTAPSRLDENTIEKLRTAGWDDGEILEINQVTAYFAYANRTVLGLGVTTDGDMLGLSPNNSENENDWSHR